MLDQFVKRCLLKLFRRNTPVQHKVNEIIGIYAVDGVFSLLFDRRIYDDLGQVVEAIYDPNTSALKPVVKSDNYPPKDLMRFHLTDGSTLTVAESIGLRVKSSRLP